MEYDIGVDPIEDEMIPITISKRPNATKKGEKTSGGFR